MTGSDAAPPPLCTCTWSAPGTKRVFSPAGFVVFCGVVGVRAGEGAPKEDSSASDPCGLLGIELPGRPPPSDLNIANNESADDILTILFL